MANLPSETLNLNVEGEHIAWYREWLYWYDKSGNRHLTAEELAHQERLARQQAEQKAQQFVERLRAIGINPDEMSSVILTHPTELTHLNRYVRLIEVRVSFTFLLH